MLKTLSTRGARAALLSLAAVAAAACADNNPVRTDPRLPPEGPKDPRITSATFLLDVNTRTGEVRITPPSQGLSSLGSLSPSFSNIPAPGGGPKFSIVAGDVVLLTASSYQASAVGQYTPGKVRVNFDVNITNRLSSVELITPTFPVPPAGTNGIILFPYQTTVTVTSGGVSVGGDGTEVIVEQPSYGAVASSTDWDGTSYNFFNDDGCPAGSTDCYRYETFGQPLAAGATSAARTVGFDIDPTVGSFRARLIVAADLRNAGAAPTGSVAGTVSSPQRGNIAGATVTVQTGSFTGTTDASGAYTINNVTTGPKTVTVGNLPAGCSVPAAQNVTVASASVSAVNFTVTCTVPSGSITGTIRRSFDNAVLAGVTVNATPSGGSATPNVSSNAPGVYSLAGVPVGATGGGGLALGNLPAGCTNASPYAYTGLTDGGTVSLDVTVSCTAPPAGYAYGYTWGPVAGGQVTLTVAIDMSTYNDPAVNGGAADDISVIQGRLLYDAAKLQYVSASNVAGSSFGSATANGATAGAINWGNFHTLSTPVTGNVQLIQFTFNVVGGATGGVATGTQAFTVAGALQIDPVTGEPYDLRPRILVNEATLTLP